MNKSQSTNITVVDNPFIQLLDMPMHGKGVFTSQEPRMNLGTRLRQDLKVELFVYLIPSKNTLEMINKIYFIHAYITLSMNSNAMIK